MTLMLLRSAGIVTILLSLILSFVGSEDGGEGDRDHDEALGNEQRRMDEQDREEAAFKRSKTDRSQDVRLSKEQAGAGAV